MRNWRDCKEQCDSNAECTHWTWVRGKEPNRQLKRKCFLKSSKGIATENENRISGSKTCGNDNDGGNNQGSGGNGSNNGNSQGKCFDVLQNRLK